MSETSYDEFTAEDDGAEQQQGQNSNVMKDLRQKAKEHTKLSTQVQTLQRENAVLKANVVDTSTPMGRLFMDAYKGDPTPEAVRAAAQEYGLVAPPAAEDTSERDAYARVANAGAEAESSAAANTLSPSAVEGWSMEKILRFRKENPDKFEALKRGEVVDL